MRSGMEAVNQSTMDWVDKWLKNIRPLFRPCVLCGDRVQASSGFCPPCLGELPWLGAAVCRRCALPLAAAAAVAEERTCGACQHHPPPYAQVWAAFRYESPISWLLQRLKYQGHVVYARLLGEVMAAEWLRQQDVLRRPELLVPVPLHPARLRQRGYNQALELARPLARILGVPLDHRSCRRLRPTAMQAGLPADRRRINVRQAFRVDFAGVNAGMGAGMGAAEVDCGVDFAGPPRHVAVIDDVLTTGATAAALTECLVAAGVARVEVWVCARTIR